MLNLNFLTQSEIIHFGNLTENVNFIKNISMLLQWIFKRYIILGRYLRKWNFDRSDVSPSFFLNLLVPRSPLLLSTIVYLNKTMFNWHERLLTCRLLNRGTFSWSPRLLGIYKIRSLNSLFITLDRFCQITFWSKIGNVTSLWNANGLNINRLQSFSK